MAYTPIAAATIAVGKAIKKSLMQLISDNLDDLDSRVSALSASANKISVFEYSVDPKDLHIGEIVSSDLTLVEYQSIHGTGWVLANGQSCTGSVYASVTGHTIVPDLRDEFLRGAGGLFTLGTTYDDLTAVNGLLSTSGTETSTHTHTGTTGTESSTHTHTPSTLPIVIGGGAGDTSIKGAFGTTTNAKTQTTGTQSANHTHTITTGDESSTHTHNISITGDAETRPQNYAVNFFIKINLSVEDSVVSIVAKEDMTIVAVQGYIVDKHGLPTSGSFEFDVRKGSTRAALSSIFTTKPSLAWSGGITDGDNTSSGAFISGGASISQGQFLDLDITGIMAGQSGMVISVYSEPA